MTRLTSSGFSLIFLVDTCRIKILLSISFGDDLLVSFGKLIDPHCFRFGVKEEKKIPHHEDSILRELRGGQMTVGVIIVQIYDPATFSK
jgi:hypothetical protein